MYWNSLEDIQKIKEILLKDQIVLASSDTVIGLYGRLTKKAYDALDGLKQRKGKPYLIMIHSVSVLPKFIDQPIDAKLQKIIDNCWPGPVTIIFKARADLPPYLQSPDGTIALRMPNHKGILSLLQSFDGLFSTSANIHTELIVPKIEQVAQSIQQDVGALCIDSENELFSTSPSTIIDCSCKPIKVVRKGCFFDDKVKDLLQ